MTSTTVLHARSLRMSFDDGREKVDVLRGVDLSLQAGETVILEGPSGSGKSTLLSILGCMLTATSGELWIGGRPISAGSDLARVRREELGFVFQQFNLIAALSAVENVAYPLRLRGMSAASARSAALAALESVGLADRAGFLPKNLSGGQKQRVAIARAITGSPKVLLADEPTASLDGEVGQRVLALLVERARRAGSALLIVTHDPRVRSLGDRTLRLENGSLMA